jgi:predicted 3-demethylubiquinone-9 3-methyltransferase (glyoxalase superfamily)
MTVEFRLEGQDFCALNGGPHYTLSPAISFFVSCNTQEEVDYYWRELSRGGKKDQCGWLTDKFGVTWQVVPTALLKLQQDKDAAKAARVMKAMFQMRKLDIAGLEKAAASAPRSKVQARGSKRR